MKAYRLVFADLTEREIRANNDTEAEIAAELQAGGEAGDQWDSDGLDYLDRPCKRLCIYEENGECIAQLSTVGHA